eukprot:15366544-Ditylum_brightwellii.AAC.1
MASLERNRLHDKDTLEEIRQQLPADNSVYQGDENHPTIYQLYKSHKEKRKARNHSFKLGQEFLETYLWRNHYDQE